MQSALVFDKIVEKIVIVGLADWGRASMFEMPELIVSESRVNFDVLFTANHFISCVLLKLDIWFLRSIEHRLKISTRED